MTTRFSTPFRINAPISSINEEFLDNTLSTQQAKYNEGFSNVAKSIDYYNNLDLVRQEDIALRDKKVSELIDKLDGYNANFDNPQEVLKLQMQAKSLSSDKDLMSRVANTANYRQLVKRYDMLKEDPKRIKDYSEINEYNDMKVANAWLNGEINSMPLRSPTLKVDKDKITGDILKQSQPRTYSYSNGLYIVNGEIRSEGDLRKYTLNTIQGNPNIQSQLMRDAQYLYRNHTPEQIYQEALQTKVDDISENRRSLLAYENQLKDATVTPTEKAELTSRVEQVKANIVSAEKDYQDTVAKFNKGDTSDLENLKYTTYANNWVRSVTQPYIIQREKRTADPAAIAVYREQSDAKQLETKMQFQARENQLNREAKAAQEAAELQFGYDKIGMQIDQNALKTTGQVRLAPGTNAIANAYYQLPVLQGEANVDAFAEISTKSQQYKNENRRYVAQLTEEILMDTDRELLSKVKPLLDNGNLFDDNGKFLGESQGISPAQIQLLKQYDELLENSINPQELKNNPLLSKYGHYTNKMIENQVKWTKLDSEKSDVIKQVFNEAWKKKEFQGSWADFQKVLAGEIISTAKNADGKRVDRKIAGSSFDPITGGYVRGSFDPSGREKFLNRINNKLNTSPIKNKFYTARAIGEDDQIYNSDKNGVNQKIFEYAVNHGVVIDNTTTSLNGNINGTTSYGNNLDNVEKIVVRGIIPNSDRVEVNLMQRLDPDKKELTPVRATLQLNPDEMRGLIGRDSTTPETEDFGSMLRNGKMEDGRGNPMFFNLNGDIPNMRGNLQYRVWDFGSGMGVSIKMPTAKGTTEVNLRGVNMTGPNKLQDVKAAMTQLYTGTYQYVASLNPTATEDELARMTIEKIYSQIEENNNGITTK